MARIEFKVLSAQGNWRVTRDSVDVSTLANKQEAVTKARALAKQEKTDGRDTQLLIQKSDGTWQPEWTPTAMTLSRPKARRSWRSIGST